MNDASLATDLTKINADVGFFDEFPKPTREDWLKEANDALKGAPFDKVMRTATYEGITLEPIYLPEDAPDIPHLYSRPGFAPLVRGTKPEGYLKHPWVIAQELAECDPATFGEEATEDLSRGQTGLSIVLAPSLLNAEPGQSKDRGLMAEVLEDLKLAIAGIDPNVQIYCHTGATALPMLSGLAALWQGNGLQDRSGCVGADPLSLLATEGKLPLALKTAYDAMARTATWARQNAPGIRTVFIQGHAYHDAGASSTQEVAFALATAAAYLRAMVERGMTPDDAAKSIDFGLSLGSSFFMEIAKLRAVKLLWEQIVAAFGGSEDARRIRIHARSSRVNTTEFDPHVNMLRITSEGFSGAMGGVDSMHLDPFDTPLRLPDRFSRRVARNVQIMLQEEAKFTIPIDMAGGSYYVEKLTDQFARTAWEIFQGIEAAGGMEAAVLEGRPQAKCAETAGKRTAAMDSRKDVLLGTNMYANLTEKKLEPRDNVKCPAPRTLKPLPADELAQLGAKLLGEDGVAAGASALAQGAALRDLLGALASQDGARQTAPVLAPYRAAARFETLRKQAEAFAEKTGTPLSIFLANLGPVAQHKPRTDFCTGFFEVAGFRMLNNEGFDTAQAAAEAALASGAPIVVICSSDAAYPQYVPELARALKAAAPNMTVIVAGKQTAEIEAEFRAAGVDDFIHVRTNCYDFSRTLQARYMEEA